MLLNGTIGTGKSTIGLAVHDVLSEAEVPHAYLDLDRLRDTYPQHGRFNEEVLLQALSVLWPVYESAGARCLVLAGVVESREELSRYEAAIGQCSITTVLLTASLHERRERIAGREMDTSLEWHLHRTEELDRILENADVADIRVANEKATPRETALAVLFAAEWLEENA